MGFNPLKIVGRRVLHAAALTCILSASGTKAQPPAQPSGTSSGNDPVPASVEGLTPVTTESGLKYYDFKVGDGLQPKPTATVTIHYSGWLTDGTLFDSTVKRGKPYTLGLNKFIKGWAEGVGSMKVGGKRRLEIPYKLAYGEQGRPPKIPAMADLVFEVELLEVLQPPEQTPVTGIEPVTTPSGLKYWDIKKGEGDSPKDEAAKVTVHYSGWLTDGTLFDSSVARGMPMPFVLNKVPTKGWTEGVLTMKVGGKRRLEIPYELGYGEAGQPPKIPPKATLIFEIELLKVE